MTRTAGVLCGHVAAGDGGRGGFVRRGCRERRGELPGVPDACPAVDVLRVRNERVGHRLRASANAVVAATRAQRRIGADAHLLRRVRRRAAAAPAGRVAAPGEFARMSARASCAVESARAAWYV